MRRSPATQLLPLLCAGLCLLPPATAWADGSAAVSGNSPAEAAPSILLAEIYRNSVDVSAYWISEKYDGVRAIWDGRILRFRSGRIVPAPAWFLAGLPQEALDGELWLGRGQFDALSAIVRREQPDEAEWRRVRYMIFELPGAPGTFSERIERMGAIVRAIRTPWLEAVAQFRVQDRTALLQRLHTVLQAGGEGLMLHRADAPYLTGRRDVLLKLKPWLDAEATVVGYRPGRGKYAGMMGGLQLVTPDGRRFILGTGFSDALRRQPLPLGTRITYRYRELTSKGLPRFASYWRIREAF
ncbi:MAG TPA: DNA ligase [Azospira sp.]|nr:DNA ligase [Azospira sp.]